MSQTEESVVAISSLPKEERRAVIAAKIAEDPKQMTLILARQLGVSEVEVIEAFPAEQVTELDAKRWEQLLRSFEELGNVHVIASNSVVTLEAFGEFGNFSTWGEFFNVQTKSLDMHIRYRGIARVFAVKKPSHMDGVPTISFQFFDRSGNSAFKVFLTFGGKEPSPEKVAAFEAIRQRFAINGSAA